VGVDVGDPEDDGGTDEPEDKVLTQVKWNVQYHRPSEEVQRVMESMREAFLALAENVIPDLPNGREKSMCATHIEEACMYAMAALARAGGPR
jgi:hypothetical protein